MRAGGAKQAQRDLASSVGTGLRVARAAAVVCAGPKRKTEAIVEQASVEQTEGRVAYALAAVARPYCTSPPCTNTVLYWRTGLKQLSVRAVPQAARHVDHDHGRAVRLAPP